MVSLEHKTYHYTNHCEVKSISWGENLSAGSVGGFFKNVKTDHIIYHLLHSLYIVEDQMAKQRRQ